MKLMSTTAIFLLCGFAAKSQQIVNGSLEPHATITPCTAGPIATYNSNMGGAWSSGTYTTIFENDNTCSSGAAAAGNSYTGIRYTYSMTAQDYNTFVLKLDAPLVKDTQYKITFSYKLDQGSNYVHSNALLIYGYTQDSLSKDSSVGSLGPLSSATWKTDTLKIKPKVNNMQYIWMEAAYGGLGSVLIYLDDFKVLHAANTVSEVGLSNNVSIYPNPVHDNTIIELSSLVTLPCNMVVYDVSGRVAMQQILHERTTTISRNNLNSGMYFIQLTDGKGMKCVKKLFAE